MIWLEKEIGRKTSSVKGRQRTTKASIEFARSQTMDVAQLAVNLPLPWRDWTSTNSLFVDIQTNFRFVDLPWHIDSTRDVASPNNDVKYFEIKAQYYKWYNVTLDKAVAKETSRYYKAFLLALIGNYMLLLAYFSRLISNISHQA